jgi:hypothetical protein
MAHAPSNDLLLTSQEWRDALMGKVTVQGGSHTKSRLRSAGIEQLLRPAMEACRIDSHRSFPVDLRDHPPIPAHQAQEIIWEVAEMNFRFELLALDRRASGLDRHDECRQCFAGGMLIAIPIEISKRGLAAIELRERHRYNVRLAKLMCAWHGVPRVLRDAAEEKTWTDPEMRELDKKVAAFYCQEFYEYFGRAAVIPMRIEHEFGT